MYPNLRSLSEQIYDWMKDRILLGSMTPGERISVDAIASGLGVSRTPIRDALNKLALEGLVVVSPRKGTVVGGLTLKDIEDVYLTRLYIEPSICAEVAENATPEFIAELEEIQKDWEKMDSSLVYRDAGATAKYVELNAAFHLRIGEETGNGQVDKILHQLYVQPQVTALVFGTSYTGPVNRMREHREIIQALKRHDPEAARVAMTDHLMNARIELAGFLQMTKSDWMNRAKLESPDFSASFAIEESPPRTKRKTH